MKEKHTLSVYAYMGFMCPCMYSKMKIYVRYLNTPALLPGVQRW